jgi:hypothetical protein
VRVAAEVAEQPPCRADRTGCHWMESRNPRAYGREQPQGRPTALIALDRAGDYRPYGRDQLPRFAERLDCDWTESGDRWRFFRANVLAIRAEGGGSARRGGSPRRPTAWPATGRSRATVGVFRATVFGHPSRRRRISTSRGSPRRPTAWPATERSRATVGVFQGQRFRPSEPKAADQHVAGGRPVGRTRGLRPDGVGRPLAFSRATVFGHPSRRRRISTSRGVAPEVSAQRGTSGAVNGGGGRSAPDPAHVMTYKSEWVRRPGSRYDLQIRMGPPTRLTL